MIWAECLSDECWFLSGFSCSQGFICCLKFICNLEISFVSMTFSVNIRRIYIVPHLYRAKRLGFGNLLISLKTQTSGVNSVSSVLSF